MAEYYHKDRTNTEENIAIHTFYLDNRSKGTITGVTDVVAFDEKEILLKTKAGKITIKGSGLTLTRLDLDHGETDIQGKVDLVSYSKEPIKNSAQIKTAIRRWR